MDRVRTRFGKDAVIRGKLYGRRKSQARTTTKSKKAKPNDDPDRKAPRSMATSCPQPKAPVASYVPVARVGNLIYVSGQISIGADDVVIEGRLGETMNVVQGGNAAELVRGQRAGADRPHRRRRPRGHQADRQAHRVRRLGAGLHRAAPRRQWRLQPHRSACSATRASMPAPPSALPPCRAARPSRSRRSSKSTDAQGRLRPADRASRAA